MQKPKLFTVLGDGYSMEQFIKDLTAGFIAGITTIPLSIALAAASGVSPEKGLIAALIAGLVISFLSGCRVQISGQTGAFVVIVYGIIAKRGFPALMLTTVMAGIILIFMGLIRLGNIMKYIPYSVTSGFSSGIAIIVIFMQIGDFLGLKMEQVPYEFYPRIREYIRSIGTININSLIIGIISLLIIISWPYINKKIPGYIAAIIVSVLVARVFGFEVETVSDRYNRQQAVFQSLNISDLNVGMITDVFPAALAIAVLAGIESLLSAVITDSMTGDCHDSNMELIGQGTANLMSGLLCGLPVAGAISRTTASVRNGGRTPVTGLAHSLVVLTALIFLMPYAGMIPVSTLAAILTVASYNMIERSIFKNMLRIPKTDMAVLLFTFILTAAVDLIVAIQFGIVLTAFLFMKRVAESSNIDELRNDINGKPGINPADIEGTDPSIQLFQASGSYFFDAADRFIRTIQDSISQTYVVIIDMRRIAYMDAAGCHSLRNIFSTCRRNKILLLLVQVQDQPYGLLRRNGFVDLMGKDNFCPDFERALVRANAYVELNRKFPLRKHG